MGTWEGRIKLIYSYSKFYLLAVNHYLCWSAWNKHILTILTVLTVRDIKLFLESTAYGWPTSVETTERKMYVFLYCITVCTACLLFVLIAMLQVLLSLGVLLIRLTHSASNSCVSCDANRLVLFSTECPKSKFPNMLLFPSEGGF